MTNTCPNCRHMHIHTDGKRETMLCRRFPPTWVLLPVPPKVMGGNMGLSKQNDYPNVVSNMSCGEHTPKLAS
jgi:hypothetical protein